MNRPHEYAERKDNKQTATCRRGPKEILTRDIARKICRIIEELPDANIPVTWINVKQNIKLRLHLSFGRNVLSQKEWDGLKLINLAFQDAKKIQRRQAQDTVLKYKNEPRSRLHVTIEKLHYKILLLRGQLEQICMHTAHYDEVSLLRTGRPYNRLAEEDFSKEKTMRRAGPKEILTKDLAIRICKMIALFPKSDIPVTWENIIKQTKFNFGQKFRRNVLSQKMWDGRRLIDEAFQNAKRIERQGGLGTSRYANNSRLGLRSTITNLQSEIRGLEEQVARVRAEQYDGICLLLDTKTPLNKLVQLSQIN